MGNFIDLTGKRFGRLTVIEKLNKKGKEWQWRCICDCGEEKIVKGVNLRSGHCLSCGCLKKESDHKPKGNVKDLTGQKFGHLTVLKRYDSDHRGEARWLCQCDCQQQTQIVALGSNLRTYHTRSCGCDRRSSGEQRIAELLEQNNIPYQIEFPAFKYPSSCPARFDFYINNTYFLEYDGEQHFNNYAWGQDLEKIKTARGRDQLKNQWCKENNIPLIRIPYTHLNKITINDLKLETTTFLI